MKAGLNIRPAAPGDIAEVLMLERETPTAPHWSFVEYEGMLHPDTAQTVRRCLFVAADGRVISGFAVCKVVEAGSCAEAEIESVVVREAQRRQGLGSGLMRAVMNWAAAEGAQHITLEVRAGSAGALRLYGGLGFVAVGRRPAYYHDPTEDALQMRCELGVRAASGRAQRPSTGWLQV